MKEDILLFLSVKVIGVIFAISVANIYKNVFLIFYHL